MERTVDDLKDPPCPECGCMMWLKRIEPVKPGHDERTFECPRCLYSESLLRLSHKRHGDDVACVTLLWTNRRERDSLTFGRRLIPLCVIATIGMEERP